jgi:glycine/D-amino acid oxidase-like deaminating enzyme
LFEIEGHTMNGRSTIESAHLSHWLAQLQGRGEDSLAPRPSLSQSRHADVCIVGAGYTGLWTAYSLLRARPSLDVVLLEAQIAGYGASGRNGGAAIAQVNGSRAYWSKRAGRAGAIGLERAVQAAIDDMGRVVANEGIDCGFSKNGVLMLARTPLELDRFRASIDDDRAWGFTAGDSTLLGKEETLERVSADHVLGARFSSHCASLDPGALVRGLARVVERAGATIYERTPALRIEPRSAITMAGTVTADVVVRATEAYTASLRSDRRRIVPVHTSMLVTEPLPSEIWAEIGWGRREAVLAEHPFLHLQHTRDDRITVGGDDNRVPYRFGSRPCPDAPAPPGVAAMYRRELVRLFPALRDVRIERTWQGIFGASRRWAPAVGIDRRHGLAWAGGFVGEGLAPSYLAAGTLADLILERESELTRLPWVMSPQRSWEPEPLRWCGANLIWAMRYFGDRREERTGRPSRLAELGNRLAGFTGHIG